MRALCGFKMMPPWLKTSQLENWKLARLGLLQQGRAACWIPRGCGPKTTDDRHLYSSWSWTSSISRYLRINLRIWRSAFPGCILLDDSGDWYFENNLDFLSGGGSASSDTVEQTCSQYSTFKYQYQYQYQYMGSKYQYQYQYLRFQTSTSSSTTGVRIRTLASNDLLIVACTEYIKDWIK